MSKTNVILIPHMREQHNSLFYPNRAEQLEIAARTKPTSQSQLIGQLPRKSPLETNKIILLNHQTQYILADRSV
jgi:hypothetical protein